MNNNDELRERIKRDLEKLDHAERRRLKRELAARMLKAWNESVKAALAAKAKDNKDV